MHKPQKTNNPESSSAQCAAWHSHVLPFSTAGLLHAGVVSVFALALLCVCSAHVNAQTEAPADAVATPQSQEDIAALEQEQLLQEYAYRLWAEINEVRRSPREALARYGFDSSHAVQALANGTDVLASGLPPLAWNRLLARSTAMHARDMIERFYYSEVNPEGKDAYVRAEEVGYAPRHTTEGLGLIAFPAFIDIGEAVDILLQNLIYDDLYILQEEQRIVFTQHATELGLTLSVENFPHIAGNEHVYLLVVDVAAPLSSRKWAVGSVPQGTNVAFRDRYTGFMDYVPTYPGGSFQAQVGSSGGTVYAFSAAGQMQDSQQIYSLANARVDLDVPEVVEGIPGS